MSSTSLSHNPSSVQAQGKSKKKHKATKTTSTQDKDEGTNPDWDYVPPEGTVLADHEIDSGDFDWDSVKSNEDLELWLVRIPEGVKPKFLENVKIDVPSSSRSAIVGVLNRKHISYDIWSIGDDEEQPIGGEEIRGLSCLLPRKKKGGKLYKAPKTIAKHLVVSAQNATPTVDPSASTSLDPSQIYQNPPRQSYPKELLKHRFMPYGSLITEAEADETSMVVDEDGSEVLEVKETATHSGHRPKGKKRKVEADSPKKSKKAKVVE